MGISSFLLMTTQDMDMFTYCAISFKILKSFECKIKVNLDFSEKWQNGKLLL